MGGHAEYGQDRCGGEAQPQSLELGRFLQPLSRQRQDDAAQAHDGTVARSELKRLREISQDVGTDPLPAAPHPHDGKVDEAESQPKCRQDPGSFPAEQVRQGAEQVHPSDLAQNAPPKPLETASFRGSVAKGQGAEEDDASQLEPARRLPVLGVLVPHEKESRDHQQDPESPVPRHLPRFLVADEGAHHQQGKRAAENVLQGAQGAVTFFDTALEGVGDGHAHGEKEHGEHDVGKSHSVLHRSIMLQPVGNVGYFPEFVDENHQEHGESPEHVDG